jgi:hypothetical protein
MLQSTGRFATPNGPKYLQQLCRHFAHKIAVEHDSHSARFSLQTGPVTMLADEAGLQVTVTAPDADSLPRARDVIDRHLVTFAFREGFTTLDWTAPAPV